MTNQTEQPTVQALLDQLRAHPDAGLVIFFAKQEIRGHVANANGIEEEDVTDEQVRYGALSMEWDMDIDYDSLLFEEE